MPARALLIAIETYSVMNEGLASTLPGTHQAALDFQAWLLNVQGLAQSDIYFCAEDVNLAGRTAGAERDDIVAELLRLQQDGKDQTETLYCFCSGHGFQYTDVDGARLTDVLLAANYRERQISGNACLKVNEIQQWLRMCMGPSDHFYFLDCCRNAVTEKNIKVGSLGLTYDHSNLGRPTIYTLYSTIEGQLAAVGSGFPAILVEALQGRGRAKVWRGKDMAVMFASVKDYVDTKLTTQPVDERKDGSGEGLIRKIVPAPQHTCDVEVRNATTTDQFQLEVSNGRGQPIGSHPFTGSRWSGPLVPDDYDLTVSTPGFAVDPLDPLPADLFEDRVVRFAKRSPLFGAATRSTRGFATPVTVRPPSTATVVARNLGRDDQVLFPQGETTELLAAGDWDLSIRDERDVHVGRRRINVTSDTPLVVDLTNYEWSPLRDALLTTIPGMHGAGTVDFSESLGPTPDQGLDLWLALMGGSRLVRDLTDDFSKLGGLPLASFEDTPAGASPVYLLAGFDDPDTRLAVAVAPSPDPPLVPVSPHNSLPGLFELRIDDLAAGSYLVRVQVGDTAPVTFPTVALAGRGTLITLCRNQRGGLRIQQFVLPITHLAHRLPFAESFPSPPLSTIRRLVDIQRQFAGSRDLTDLLSEAELLNLLYLKWFEPIAAVLAAYELARRGATEMLPVAVGNLRRHLPHIPDTEAIARLAGLAWTMPASPPLFLDGLLALDLMPGTLVLPAERLDFSGPWTRWRG